MDWDWTVFHSAFRTRIPHLAGFDPKQYGIEINWLGILDTDFDDRARAVGGDVVEDFHRFQFANDG